MRLACWLRQGCVESFPLYHLRDKVWPHTAVWMLLRLAHWSTNSVFADGKTPHTHTHCMIPGWKWKWLPSQI